MKGVLLMVATALLLPATGRAQPQRGLNLRPAPPPSPFLPLPPAPPRVGSSPGSIYDLAPTPNRDLDAPLGPRATTDPQLAPSLFTRGQQYRGEGFSGGSTAQAEQERRAQPGAGFKLRMPLQQN